MHNPRPDILRQRRTNGDDRPVERLIAHYLLERRLADRLRCASAADRPKIYHEVYNELFASLPDHPQHQKASRRKQHVEAQLKNIARHLEARTTFLEIGCGDAALAFAVADRVARVYGLDVTDSLIMPATPRNFKFLLTSGTEIPLPNNVVDFAYSDQVMEHLHPDDAAQQMQEVFRVLKPGGFFLCITPNRLTGPHDISCYFDYESTGLHLKEYDHHGLRNLFAAAGFRRFSSLVFIYGRQIPVPFYMVRLIEGLLLTLPPRMRAYLTWPTLVRRVLGLTAIAVK